MYGIKTIPFCDTEFEVDGLKLMWGGEFCIDEEGYVVGICREWLGDGEDRIHYEIPPRHREPETLNARAALALAKVIERDFKPEITDELYDWSVSIAEREWEQPEAAE